MTAVKQLKQQAVSIIPISKPEPLISQMQAPTPYPIDALGEVLAGAAKAIQKATQAPTALCGQSVLMAAALYAQGVKNVETPHGSIPLSLFSIAIAESGERKTTVDKLAMRPINNHAQNLYEQYQKDLAEFKILRTAYQQAEKAVKAGVPKDLPESEVSKWVTDKLKAIGQPPKEPLIPTFTTGDATIEGISKHLMRALPVLGIYTDEAGVFFGGHSMSKDARSKTISLLSKAWDGAAIEMIRADSNVGAVRLVNRRISINLMAQPIIISEAMRDDLLIGQGFLARFLFSFPASNIGNRPYNEFSALNDDAFKRYHALMMERLEAGFMMNEASELQLTPLQLATKAKDRYTAFLNDTETKQGSNGEYAHIKGTASKIAEQALRIAGVLTVIKQGNQANFISESEMKAGIEIASYSLNEYLRIIAGSQTSQSLEDAIKLLDWITDKQHKLIYPALLSATAPNQIRKKERYDNALMELVEHGYLEFITGGAVIDGINRKEAYKVLHYAES